MKKIMNKGFTLIELLVVIAIIGILAATVFASLNDARDKGKDASIKTSLSSVRAQMEIFYASNGNSYLGSDTANSVAPGGAITGYAGGCDDANVEALLVSAAGNSTDATSGCATEDDGASYVAWVALNDPSTGVTDFCVDSSGFAGEINGDATAVVTATVSCS